MVKKIVKIILCIVIFRGLILACIDLSMVWKEEPPLLFEEISIMFQITVHAFFSICLGEILYIVMYPSILKNTNNSQCLICNSIFYWFSIVNFTFYCIWT